MSPLRTPQRKSRPPISQVFLDDVRVARGIAQALGLPKGSRVLEIGPGKGALTRALLDEGFEVLAVERDPRMIEELAPLWNPLPPKQSPLSSGHAPGLAPLPPFDLAQDTLKGGGEGLVRLKLVIADALSFPMAKAAGLGYGHLAGNLPYHITGMIFRKVFESSRYLKGAVFMIQDEVADRLVSRSGSQRSLLTLAAELHCASLDKVFTVAPSSFRPQPKVHSGVIKLVFREKPLLDPEAESRFFVLLKAAFSQKRKTLHNTLADCAGTKKEAAERLASAGVDPSRRAETLSLEEAIRLTEAFA